MLVRGYLVCSVLVGTCPELVEGAYLGAWSVSERVQDNVLRRRYEREQTAGHDHEQASRTEVGLLPCVWEVMCGPYGAGFFFVMDGIALPLRRGYNAVHGYEHHGSGHREAEDCDS